MDRWSEQRIWDAVLDQVRIVVSTHAVLADALGHGFVKMAQLVLLIFDEGNLGGITGMVRAYHDSSSLRSRTSGKRDYGRVLLPGEGSGSGRKRFSTAHPWPLRQSYSQIEDHRTQVCMSIALIFSILILPTAKSSQIWTQSL